MQMADSQATSPLSDIMSGLQDPLRLHREAALQKLEGRLQDREAADRHAFLDAITEGVLQLLSSDVWQHRLGAFDAAQVQMSFHSRMNAHIC